ncbi:MAG: Flp pilus assembly protein CpaB [Rickettsiales bacterium]
MRLIGIIIALLLAVGAFFVAMKFLNSGQPQQTTDGGSVVVGTTQPDVQTAEVLTAAQDIPVGTVLTPEMLTSQPWPQHLIIDGFITKEGDNSKNVVGMVTRSSFQAKEPIIFSRLANRNDPGFLAAALPSGKKVVTISTDGVAGVSGFIFPGDRVDVMVTHDIPDENADPEKDPNKIEKVTETLLSNIKVLAVDQRAAGGPGKEDNKVPTTISLEATLEDSQKLRLAQETGYLSLMLRSLDDRDTTDTGVMTKRENVTLSKAYDENFRKKGIPVKVVRGTSVETIEPTATPAMIDDEDRPAARN